MRRCRFIRVLLAAVLSSDLFRRLMMLVTGSDDCLVRRLCNLSDGHRSAALEGQHRDRDP